MFVTFFQELKSVGVPVTLREYLTLMEGMQADLASRRVEDCIISPRGWERRHISTSFVSVL